MARNKRGDDESARDTPSTGKAVKSLNPLRVVQSDLRKCFGLLRFVAMTAVVSKALIEQSSMVAKVSREHETRTGQECLADSSLHGDRISKSIDTTSANSRRMMTRSGLRVIRGTGPSPGLCDIASYAHTLRSV